MSPEKAAGSQTFSRILIVEDSPTQAKMLQYMLEKHDFQVTVAANGREALTLLTRMRPIAVISDIVMPELDGYELCRLIKGDQGLREIPVILLTSLADPEDVIMGLECGADYFIMKPYNEEFLLSRIQHILANRNLQAELSARMGLEIFFRGKQYFINSDRLQILNLLLSTYETAIQKNRELAQATEELSATNEQLQENMVELELKHHEMERLNAELQQQRAVVEESMRRAEEASRAKSDFLANMSHELRTPLNSIIGFSEVLQDELYGPLNPKQRQYTENILTSGRHLLALINDILDLSKVEAGKLELEPSVVNLHLVLTSALTMLQEKAIKHNLHLALDLADSGEVELIADERKLKQIIFNLLSNAVKFTPEGGSIWVSARRRHATEDEPACIEVVVADSGIGIKEEDLPKLFKEFCQLDAASTRDRGGTGLGLALTKRMVELHGGRIWVESEFGRGSRFFFTIPLGD